MFLGELIKEYRKKNNLSQRVFAKRCGLSYTYISALEKNMDYRSGKPISPTLETVRSVAKGMNTPIDDFLKLLDDNQNFTIKHSQKENNNTFYMTPVYGRIAAGQPNWAEECLDGYLPIDPVLMNIASPEECFFLKVSGESMNKVVTNGSYALIRKTDFVNDGEIAVVLVNGDDATLKKFTKKNDVIVLEPMSNDPTITTQIYGKETPIKVIGKYIGKMEMNER